MKLGELGEFGLIDTIARRVPPAPSVVLGIGDDAAALRPGPGALTLVTCDMLLEGVHFDLSFSEPISLGRKSLAVNLSDLAAMGARPRHVLLGLALPAALSFEFVDQFMQGIQQMCERYGATLVGGDTCASKGGLAISITALGEQEEGRVVTRSGARAGDLVCVTGTVGDSAAGLCLLQKGAREGYLVGRHLDPTPRVELGVALAEAGLLHAMIDVSDGVLADLGHIMELSEVGARLELGRLPLSREYREFSAGEADPFALALSGGEDYELLVTLAPEKLAAAQELAAQHGLELTVVGEVLAGEGLEIVAPDGGGYQPAKKGFDHFG